MRGRLLQPSALGVDHVPQLRDGAELLPVGDESVVFEEDSGMLHQLDVTATLICRCFDGESTVADIVDDMAEVFEVDRAVIEADVLAMVRELGHKGLLAGVVPPTTEDD